MSAGVGAGLQHSSGRIIGLGRVLLGTLYLIAIYADAGQPERFAETTYLLLAAYLALAIALVSMVWEDWWLEAKLAGPAHAVDIAFFTALVVLTEGYTSPSFSFFVFVLLSAAIRWGWRATALTSLLLILLYLIAGLLVSDGTAQRELQLFAVRTGQLLILSLILIWFGASRWSGHRRDHITDLAAPAPLDQSPLEGGLRATMTRLRAAGGTFVWKASGEDRFDGIAIRAEARHDVSAPAAAFERATALPPFLYDVAEDRALRRDASRNLVDCGIAEVFAEQDATAIGLTSGLAIPVRTGDGEGLMFLERVPGLSTDYLDLGEQIAAETAALVQAHALLRAAEERAESRSRLTLARDLHDGIVQFLAGAAFRLEAIRRSNGGTAELGPELDELKKLILQEQADLRSFISALRAGPLASFADLAHDLNDLAARLSQQWNVSCSFSAEPAELTIPTRVQIDVHQLVREAVANAVRHAEARLIKINLAAVGDQLRLTILNSGMPRQPSANQSWMPRSLTERVEHAGGEIDIARGMNKTRVSIALPVPARAQ